MSAAGASVFLLALQPVILTGSAQWGSAPVSNDWNTAKNWSPPTVPNAPTDIATFDVSATTNLSISAITQVGDIVFNPGASKYTIVVPQEIALYITGEGIRNDSGTDGQATFTNNAATMIAARGGSTYFSQNSAAGDATFINNGAAGFGIGSGVTSFSGNSSAGHCRCINNGGVTDFFGNATATSATLIANADTNGIPGGEISFLDDSSGGMARIELFGDGDLEISNHNAPGVTVGSIEGTGNIFLGPNNLTVGSNNRSLEFAGVIQEGGGRLPGGTLTKIGTGTLGLQGANTYPGMTTVNGGVLNVDGSLAGSVTVNGGLLGGSGTVGAVTVNSGGEISPGEDMGILNVHGNFVMAAGSRYVAVLFGTTLGTEYNQANVSGKINLTKSTLAVRLEYFPRAGDKFIIIKNDGADPVKGKFNGLGEGAKFRVDGLRFKISYKGGGGNDVVLTVLR